MSTSNVHPIAPNHAADEELRGIQRKAQSESLRAADLAAAAANLLRTPATGINDSAVTVGALGIGSRTEVGD